MAIGTKQKLALGLAVLVAAAAVLVPTVAFAGDDRASPAATDDMAGHKMAGQSMAADSISPSLLLELLRVALATARFHDLDAALKPGYELAG